MLRVPLVTILAREMRLKFLKSTKLWRCCSAASHDTGATNPIENFLKSTKLWRCCECRKSRYWQEKCNWKYFEVDRALEMLRVSLVTILEGEMRLKFFWSRPSFGDVASAASHDIGARNAIEIFSSRPSFWGVASAAIHDISARNAIENFLKSTKLWRCCVCR